MSQSRFSKWLPALAVVSVLVLAVAACSNDEVTPDDVVTAGSEQVSTTQTDEAMEDSESDEAMTDTKSDEEMMDGESDEEMMDGESDEAMTDGDSDEAMTDGDSDEAMMDGESDEEMMDGGSDEAMMDGDSDETMMDGDSDEAMMDGESDEAMVEGDSDEEMMGGESDEAMTDTKSGEEMKEHESDEAMMDVALPENIVAPHFVGSLPLHGDALSQAPVAVVLNFNLSLNANSSIMVTRGGESVPIEVMEIAEDRLSMQALLDGVEGSGVYQVDYTACWPDGSCHEGTIGFSVDPSVMNG